MHNILIPLCVFLLAACQGSGPEPASSALLRHTVQRLTEVPFEPVATTKEIPPEIMRLILPDESGGMADPGEEFQETDVVEDESLPWTRLIYAGKWQAEWVIAFQHGGEGYHDHLIILSARDKAWTPMFACRCYLNHSGIDPEPLLHDLRQVAAGTFRNELDQWETLHW